MLDSVFSFIASWIVDVLLTVVFYWPGWLVLRVVTLGRYPPEQKQAHNVLFVSAIGASALLTALTVIYWLWSAQ